ncbi:DUF1428 domain-containing protein [Sphingomonas sp. SRS2]|uniref:DUF1428 domain-containing protein n=1 Tax=Sphingomonas sp. SRS2 TaxID=133190 RepID=UPI0006184A09|nr:DUF1428 domain-containing protein [Sphingomonas sp. SRS2]KKC24957.1 RNA signal recognition particle 4.5S RNA [Sphingomonas sp. SRS2]
MAYVDGFIVAVPRDKIDAYIKMAETARDVWMELGALSYVEALADDVSPGELTSFPRAVQLKDDETVVFSWITYESRESRDAIMKKVMDDPRMKDGMENMPFDGKRMIYGGFRTIVES